MANQTKKPKPGKTMPQIMRTACVPHDTPDAIKELAEGLGGAELEIVILFISPMADVKKIIWQAKERFAPALVVGCTTAGEIAKAGYAEGNIVAIGFPRQNFRSRILFVENLDDFESQDLVHRMLLNRNAMKIEMPQWESEFNFLLIDGLSTKEDALASHLAVGLGAVPLFGGSAGDGTDFKETYILHDGHVHTNVAALIQFSSNCPVSVFKTDHLIPTEQRMVVTSADPASRRVHCINAEPAAQEYARILGKDPKQLSTMTFAAHPVVVRLGGQHHVRSIQQVAENGDLIFFSAIAEGMVLSLADPQDMVEHLKAQMASLSENGQPDMILACDCLFRKIEAEQKQLTRQISDVLVDNRVVGFSTYGEQFNSIHVNQTLTGVAFYPPQKATK